MWIADNKPEWRVWGNNSGAIKTEFGRFIRFGLKGSADIVGITGEGIFVGVEIKTGKSRQSPQQKRFMEMIRSRGGIYILVKGGMTFEEAFK